MADYMVEEGNRRQAVKFAALDGKAKEGTSCEHALKASGLPQPLHSLPKPALVTKMLMSALNGGGAILFWVEL